MNEVRKFRKALGLSQEEFARLFMISQSMLSQWESGDKSASTDTILRLREMINFLPSAQMETSGDLDAARTLYKEEMTMSIQKKIREKEIELLGLEHELTIMQRNFTALQNALLILMPESRIFQSIPTYKAELDKITLPRLKSYIENGPEAQQIRVMRIASVQAEIASLQAQIALLHQL